MKDSPKSTSIRKKILDIIFRINFMIVALITFLIFSFRTVSATHSVWSIILGIIFSVILWFILRKRKHARWIFIVAIIILFIPAIPVYFTHMSYTNTVVRDICLALFIGFC